MSRATPDCADSIACLYDEKVCATEVADILLVGADPVRKSMMNVREFCLRHLELQARVQKLDQVNKMPEVPVRQTTAKKARAKVQGAECMRVGCPGNAVGCDIWRPRAESGWNGCAGLSTLLADEIDNLLPELVVTSAGAEALVVIRPKGKKVLGHVLPDQVHEINRK
jgi:hypothetical protein